jgi:hypothetical protein
MGLDPSMTSPWERGKRLVPRSRLPGLATAGRRPTEHWQFEEATGGKGALPDQYVCRPLARALPTAYEARSLAGGRRTRPAPPRHCPV